MNISKIRLPVRESKPRNNGITVLIDNGVPFNLFKDTIESFIDYIDFVKFGWGTSIVTNQLERKIECLVENKVHFFFGGTLFEKFLSQGKVDEYYSYCQTYGCKFVEISNGTLNISNTEKAQFIKDFKNDFFVFSEVGSKSNDDNQEVDSSLWLEWIQEDFEAGSSKVITESRESGTSGVCLENGELRVDIIESIVNSNLELSSIIFEAPNKKMQSIFVNRIGPNVNLANIPFGDVISLETLRLGLRSDTFQILDREMETK